MGAFPPIFIPTRELRWRRYTVTELQFSGGGTAQDIELFSLPGGGVIHAVKTKHSTAFSGGGALTATLSVGITGTLAKYAAAFDVFQAVGDTTQQLSTTVGTENHTAATSIRVNLIVTVGTVGGLTAGVADIWVLWGVAK